jgi:nucleoside-diphosphate-sugar epimerase/lipopolysaccharide/colanic/teichoic acid biosynthesis glycosyltransferase
MMGKSFAVQSASDDTVMSNLSQSKQHPMIAVTGATGFVGRSLVALLVDRGCGVIALARRQDMVAGLPCRVVPDLRDEGSLREVLKGCDVVIHLAALAHKSGSVTDFLVANRDVTKAVAKAALAAGAKRFVLVSSIGVIGERTEGKPFGDDDIPAPSEPYAQSKWEAEQAAFAVLEDSGTSLVVLRPPLIYGAGCPGNFGKLMKLIDSFPLVPLGGLSKLRSFIFLENFCDAVFLAAMHPKVKGQTYVLSDGHEVTVAEVARYLEIGFGRNPDRIVKVPAFLLRMFAAIGGRTAAYEKLTGELQVDSSRFRNETGWIPRFKPEVALVLSARQHSLFRAGGPKGRSLKRSCYSFGLLRLLDVLFSSLGLLICAPLLFTVWLLGLFDTGSPLFLQRRVGRHKQPFTLVKFRTMRLGTASVASHLASADSVTWIGSFLRRTKVDELPQLWNVLKGEMSLVGPRPGLFNQTELLAARDRHGVYSARPGITGLAQVSGIDMSTPDQLAEADAKMIAELNARSYFRYIFQTIFGAGRGDAVRR